MNRAWSKGKLEKLEEYFHKDVVMVAPEFNARAEGREACIESYEEFIGRATVAAFRESDIVIDIWGATGVSTYSWDIEYELGGQVYKETGRELLVFVRTRGRWQLVWRALMPDETQG